MTIEFDEEREEGSVDDFYRGGYSEGMSKNGVPAWISKGETRYSNEEILASGKAALRYIKERYGK